MSLATYSDEGRKEANFFWLSCHTDECIEVWVLAKIYLICFDMLKSTIQLTQPDKNSAPKQLLKSNSMLRVGKDTPKYGSGNRLVLESH